MKDIKQTNGKPPLHLVPLHALEGAARVMAFGDAKYRPKNWLGAVDEGEAGARKYVGAMLRHLAYLWDDLDAVDSDSGEKHVDHVLCNAIFLCEILRRQGAAPAGLPSDLVGKRVTKFAYSADDRDFDLPESLGSDAWDLTFRPGYDTDVEDWTIVEVRDGWARPREWDSGWLPVDAIAEVE